MVFLIGGWLPLVAGAWAQMAAPPFRQADERPCRYPPTGFFRTIQDDGRWWLVDPEGRPFFIVGTDHVRYDGHYCEKLGYAPYGRFVQEKYPDEQAWAETAVQRLKSWGFNTLASAHSRSLRHRGLPHIEFLAVGQGFARRHALCPPGNWTGFPDVFHPDWPAHCEAVAAGLCAPARDDPWLIGYFLDNELEWYGKAWKRNGLFEEAWKLPADRPAKQAWIAFLRRELGTIEAFREHFGTSAADFASLADHTDPRPALTDTGRALYLQWVGHLAEAYFREAVGAIRRHDPNHLVLGCRFAGPSPGAWAVAGRYCDVVSFNYYPMIDLVRGVPPWFLAEISEAQGQAGKPMMITEWSFPALDTECPSTHGAGMRVDTQAQKARCFEYFQEAMFRLPFMVGSNYFMYLDEPPLGIHSGFPENSNYGLVNNRDEPYPDLTAAAARLNPRVYELHEMGPLPLVRTGQWLASWMRELQPIPLPVGPDIQLTVEVGPLTFKGPVEGNGWTLQVRSTPLGRFMPFFQQKTPLDAWVGMRHASLVGIGMNEHGKVYDMEFVGGPEPAALSPSMDADADPQIRSGPRSCRTGWRFWLPDSILPTGEPIATGWFAAQCRWVENTDIRPWTLAAIHHHLIPNLGDDSRDDRPLDMVVPLYHRRGAAWTDDATGWSIGCWIPADMNFYVHYWKGSEGDFHPDLHFDPFATLDPGERREFPDAPVAFFLAFEGRTREAYARATEFVERQASYAR